MILFILEIRTFSNFLFIKFMVGLWSPSDSDGGIIISDANLYQPDQKYYGSFIWHPAEFRVSHVWSWKIPQFFSLQCPKFCKIFFWERIPNFFLIFQWEVTYVKNIDIRSLCSFPVHICRIFLSIPVSSPSRYEGFSVYLRRN